MSEATSMAFRATSSADISGISINARAAAFMNKLEKHEKKQEMHNIRTSRKFRNIARTIPPNKKQYAIFFVASKLHLADFYIVSSLV